MTRPPERIPWWPDLAGRLDAVERMDDLHSDPGRLRRTLRQFPLLNRLVSRSRYLLKQYLLEDIRRRGLRSVRLLDAGAGGGDIARYLVRAARNTSGAVMHVDCCEADPRVAEFARRACADYPTVSVVERSVLDLPDATSPYDYVFSNHFLHHLSAKELVAFFNTSRRLCSGTLLCNDLQRSRLSYTAYRVAAPLFLRRSFAPDDGALSIRRGFLKEELEDAIMRSDWAGQARVGSIEPGRLYVVARAE